MPREAMKGKRKAEGGTRELRGAISGFRGRTLVGWVFVPGEEPLTVHVRINGKRVATGIADVDMRDHWIAREHITGKCGFEIAIPDDVVIEDGDRVSCASPGADGEWARNPSLVKVDEDGRISLAALTKTARRAADDGDAYALPQFGVVPERKPGRIVLDVWRALFLREVRNRYGAFRFGYFWAVAQPMLYIAVLQSARMVFRGTGESDLYGVNGLYFFQLAVIPWFMYQHGYHQAMGSMKQYKGAYTYRQIQPIDVILVKCALEFLILLVAFLLFMAIFAWLGMPISFRDPAGFVAVLGLLYLLTTSLGLIADVFITRNEDMRRVFALVDRPLFIMSGVFFTLDAMPEALHPYVLWNPLLHAIELCRATMLHNYPTPASWTYLVSCTIAAMMFALGLYRRNLYRLTNG